MSEDRSWEDLSVHEQETINGLVANIERPETCSAAKGHEKVIKNALIKNPAFLENAMKLQTMGAELVVTDFQEGKFMKFADAADNLNIEEQEKALTQLTEDEINAAITKILKPLLSKAVQDNVEQWLRDTLRRPDNATGLNWVEGLVLAVHHGGTIITQKKYGQMANSHSIYENQSQTWYSIKSLAEVMQDKQHSVSYGFRKGKDISPRCMDNAANRSSPGIKQQNRNRGVRIADIMVVLA